MPTVIGLNQVPPNTPRPTFHDYYGQLYGTAGRQLTDAVLAYLTSGAYQNNQQKYPNPSYGQSSLPTLNPDVTLQQASPPLNPLAPPPNPQAVSRQFAQPAQPPLFPPTQPKISLRDIEAAQAVQRLRQTQQQMQQQADLNSPLNQFLSAQAGQMRGNAQRQTETPGLNAGWVSSTKLETLHEKAKAGDELSQLLLRALFED